MPWTPQGQVGERSVMVSSVGGQRVETVVEVIELEPGRRVVTASVPFNGATTTYCLVTQNGRTRLEVGHRYKVSLAEAQFMAPGWRSSITQAFEDHLDPVLMGVRDLIEEGWVANVSATADERRADLKAIQARRARRDPDGQDGDGIQSRPRPRSGVSHARGRHRDQEPVHVVESDGWMTD